MCSVGFPTQALPLGTHTECGTASAEVLPGYLQVNGTEGTFLKPLCRQGKAAQSWEKEKLSFLSMHRHG